jgi:thymidine kinase
MFAGKSTLAVSTIRRWRSLEKNVLVLKHSRDTRYGENTHMFTHDTPVAPVDCQPVEALLPVLEERAYAKAQVIVIEEAQFFPDLYDFCVQATDTHGKQVYVFGLDGMASRKPFGQMCQLCPIADSFVKIPAFCQMCKDGTKAPFTVALRTIPESGLLIGGQESYAAVCRRHYLLHQS